MLSGRPFLRATDANSLVAALQGFALRQPKKNRQEVARKGARRFNAVYRSGKTGNHGKRDQMRLTNAPSPRLSTDLKAQMPVSPDQRPDPVQPSDAEARALARQLLAGANHAALACLDESGAPIISRIAFGLDPEGGPMTLISGLAPHFAALRADPRCSVMVGEVGDKGDPLTHPRLMIRALATFVAPDDPARPDLRTHWLKGHPKAALYVDFADFAFVRLVAQSALLNGGFARAFRLTPEDLRD